MAIVAGMDFELHQLDVKTTFFNAKLKEDIYMSQLKSFIWTQTIVYIVVFEIPSNNLGFRISSNPLDHRVYSWKCRNKLCILSLYVGDMLLAGNCMDMINETKLYPDTKFEVKDIGEASYILRIL